MNNNTIEFKGWSRYIILGLTLALAAFLIYRFSSIVAYVLIAFVVSFVTAPMAAALNKIKIKKWQMPRWLSALLTLLTFWIVIIVFFILFIPMVIHEVEALSNLDINSIISNLEEPIYNLENRISGLIISEDGPTIREYITEKLSAVLDVSIVGQLIATITGVIGNIFIAIFSISFIAFFFLKEDYLFEEALLVFFPRDKEDNIRRALSSIKKLLMRYFIGIFAQISGILILLSIGLSIIGLEFSHALVIALFAGIVNVIPYVGPLIGTAIGITMGVATSLPMDFYTEIVPLMIYMGIVFLSVQMIDNFIFQPLIYGSSVHAHPLEIFIVILIAGSLAGIPGMILAIPGYTVIRVIAKEFFNNYRLVQKITGRM